MSDYRHELRDLIEDNWNMGTIVTTDAILERFDVTPKPVVSDEDLGRWVTLANGTQSHYGRIEHVGQRMFSELESHGLKIVRVDDHD